MVFSLTIKNCWLTGLTVVFAAALSCTAIASVTIDPADSAPLKFAAGEIERASVGARTEGPAIRLEVVGGGVAQSYRIERAATGAVRVLAGDPVGGMYGGLEVAEAIRLGTLGQLTPGEHRPYIARRGIKFNIPLDVRTPSYSDNSTAFQANIPEMWSMEFWHEFFDEMARQRFNVLSLWNLHPFPSIVKVPEYPEVALADVMRARFDRLDDSFSFNGDDMFQPKLLEGAEVVKRMTIDEKIAFWRAVMQAARDRGIDVYWFTWNAFLFGAEGKHGLNRSKPDENMIRYFRASVRETVKTYPLLAGMGITAGEYMGQGLAGRSKEQWLWQTYGEGIRDALQEQPDRSFRLIHRFHMSDMNEVLEEWRDYPGPFDFSYKYAVAHMYAAPRPPFIDPLLEVLPSDRRTWLTVRNDDIYSFRWGDPQFARDFMKAVPGPEVVNGFYMGPDGYCWGREAMDLNPHTPRQLVMQKQWFSFMLWGRLAYDPTLTDDFFCRVLAERFDGVDAATLLAAWSSASRVFPEITRFFWGNIDLKWLPEACLSHPRFKGFYTVRHFIEGETMPGSGNLTIRQWRQALVEKQPMGGTTPLEVAAKLRSDATAALAGVEALRGPAAGAHNADELALTLGDIEAFGRLGLYYAAKIEGACELAWFDADSDPVHRQAAIGHLTEALGHWRDYAAIYARQYRQPLLYNRVGWVDIPKLVDKVAEDIELARQWRPGTVPPPPANSRGFSIYGQ